MVVLAQQGGNMWIWMIVILVLMWILMMRPQRKKEKEEQKFRNELKKGDRVLFSGGIYGKVHSVDTHTVDVEVSNGVVVTVEKSMIQPAPEPKADDKK
ncbi:MAG: preprotein translocase subunit YajC [Bacteroidales bacterium]|nr:preprotein translocase subunit YajC [Bacteroidales bacterium]MBR6441988.1 preprotein translocase subunit YajC [Bacteroidales bacterium]